MDLVPVGWGGIVKPELRFENQGGVWVPQSPPDVRGANLKYERFYNKIAGLYDLWEILFAGWFHGGRDAARHELLDKVKVRPGDRVLEVSIGTGVNLRYLPAAAEYWGLDISRGMLRRGRRNLRRWKREATLLHGTAEALPFQDEVFDVAFHIGGINFFHDPGQAVREMMRVAKRGALVLYGDETEKTVQEAYAKTPFVGKYFEKEQVGSPLAWLPAGVVAEHEVILKGMFYIVHFNKGAA